MMLGKKMMKNVSRRIVSDALKMWHFHRNCESIKGQSGLDTIFDRQCMKKPEQETRNEKEEKYVLEHYTPQIFWNNSIKKKLI